MSYAAPTWGEMIDQHDGHSVHVEQPMTAFGVDDPAVAGTMINARPLGPRHWWFTWPNGFVFETQGEQPLRTLLTGVCIP